MAERIPVLRARQLRFGWPDHPLLRDLSFDLPPGLSLVTGDDGCGKSSLLRLLAGELHAHSGTLTLTGCEHSPTHRSWRERVFWIDPQTEVHDATSATSYLEGLHEHWPGFSMDAMAELVEGFELAPHLAKPLYMLSTGSKRKVWLTAAFAARAPITLIDQPFAALDGPAMYFLRELLGDVANHPSRAWLIAAHAPPAGVRPAFTLRL